MPEMEQAAGRVFADRRRKAKHTQESLAEACDVHPTYISQMERGLKSPTLRVLFRLAKAMNLSPSALVKDIERELSRPEPAAPAKKSARAPQERHALKTVDVVERWSGYPSVPVRASWDAACSEARSRAPRS